MTTTEPRAPLLIEMAMAAPLCAVVPDGDKVIHAVTMEAIIDQMGFGEVPKEMPAACGAKPVKAFWLDGVAVLPWPVSTVGLTKLGSRCAECWDLTGRKRPRSRVCRA